MDKDMEYEKKNIISDGINQKKVIKCKNHELCGFFLTPLWFSWMNQYICISCYIMFGKWKNKGVLKFIDNIDCPICLDVGKGLELKRCNHAICIKC